MNLNTEKWIDFQIEKLFNVEAGKYYYSDEYSEGDTPYCSASAENNGVAKKIDLLADFEGNKIITGKVGCTTFYEPMPFCATSDVNVLTAKFDMTPAIGLFIATVINKNENYRWNYGRQCRVGNTKKITIKLPAVMHSDGCYVIDQDRKYSKHGYIPDFAFMEQYIKSLHYKSITTQISNKHVVELDTSSWKNFYLHKIFNATMGNGIDAISTTHENPVFNYVGRSANNNGVTDIIDEIAGEKVFPAGAITLPLGGSIGACFLQTKPFYTAQNVAVLLEKVPLSIAAKMFIVSIIKTECLIKFQPFGRELNAHFRKDFILRLPVKHNRGKIEIDSRNIFSDEGYIPDWQWMENYIKELPYSDRI